MLECGNIGCENPATHLIYMKVDPEKLPDATVPDELPEFPYCQQHAEWQLDVFKASKLYKNLDMKPM